MPHPATPTAVYCASLTKAFGRVKALSAVDLEVEAGSTYGFLGPNGAGKSTLVKILTGLVRPDSGELQVLGGKPGAAAIRAKMGYLPEHFRFPPWLTGRELLSYHANLVGTPADVDWLLGLLGLKEARDRRIGTFSKGMQQRLGLAQALVGNPSLVLLDEPTSALDPLGRLEIRDLLHQLREWGTTVFLNSHLLTEVEQVCNRVAIIRNGSILAEGSLSDLLAGPRAEVRIGPTDAPARIDALLAAVKTEIGREATYEAGLLSTPYVDALTVPSLVRLAVREGFPVYEAGLEKRSLEETFVQLMEEGRRNDPAVSEHAR